MIEHGMSSIESRDQMFFRGPPRACPHIRETEIFRDIMTSFQPRSDDMRSMQQIDF